MGHLQTVKLSENDEIRCRCFPIFGVLMIDKWAKKKKKIGAMGRASYIDICSKMIRLLRCCSVPCLSQIATKTVLQG